jgi:hypothetical protein
MLGEFAYGDDAYIPEEYMDEEWGFINGHSEYRVSDKGRVWSGISNKFMKPTSNVRSGHQDLSFKVNGKREHAYIHRLVAEAFIPNPNDYPLVRHLDDDPANNCVWNLAWGTQEDNVRDMYANGSGSNRPIILLSASGEKEYFPSHAIAANELGVSKSAISLLKSGKNKTCKGRSFWGRLDCD